MTDEEFAQINQWISDPRNLAKLYPLERARFLLLYEQFKEDLAKIIVPAMSRDKSTKFLFKM